MKLRSLFALALAALLVPAAASAAPAKTAASAKAAKTAAAPTTSTSTPFDQLTVGGFVGYETDDVSGISLRLDGEIPFQALTPQINMSWVGSIGYSHLTDDRGFGFDFTSNVLKIVPAARFTVPVNPQVSIFGDAGLGIAYVSAKLSPPAGFEAYGLSDSSLNIMMRIGAGAWFQVNPQLKIGAMLEFDPIFGDYGISGVSSQSTFLIQGGAMFKI